MMRLIPNFRGFDFFPHDLRLPFMRYKGLCLALSVIAMVLSLAVIWAKGFNYGVDFTGGTVIEVQSKSGAADVAGLREKLNALGIGSVQIQSFGNDTDVLIRVEQQKGGEAEQKAAITKVTAALGDKYEQRRFELVGPAVSSELRWTGFTAVLAGLLAIVLYVWMRFEWQFAVGAIVALTHDVLLVAGIFSALQLEFDLSIVAALLTILGYSVNDTVVVSDRIRENSANTSAWSSTPPRPVDQRDAVAHHPDGLHRHRGPHLALHLRRRGDPQLQPGDAAGRHHRHLLVDLHRRAAVGLPGRQARLDGADVLDDRRSAAAGQGGIRTPWLGAGSCKGVRPGGPDPARGYQAPPGVGPNCLSIRMSARCAILPVMVCAAAARCSRTFRSRAASAVSSAPAPLAVQPAPPPWSLPMTAIASRVASETMLAKASPLPLAAVP